MTAYRGQYEILDQDMHTSELETKVRQQMSEDLLRIGYVPAGEMSAPEIAEFDGVMWAIATVPVRPASEMTYAG